MGDYNTHNLIIIDDNLHSHQHFSNAIKTVFPTFPDKMIRCICALVNKAGSATCAMGCAERLEMSKAALERFNIKCVIERRI